jgi:hypothetical protein
MFKATIVVMLAVNKTSFSLIWAVYKEMWRSFYEVVEHHFKDYP